MTKIIKGNLELTKDTVFDEPLVVEGSIIGKDGTRYNLTVIGDIDAGDINAENIDAGDINAWDINARDIDAGDINALDINARDIDAYFILCKTLKQKEGSKLIAKNLIEQRSKLEQKEIKR
jgi:hypothetical protein